MWRYASVAAALTSRRGLRAGGSVICANEGRRLVEVDAIRLAYGVELLELRLAHEAKDVQRSSVDGGLLGRREAGVDARKEIRKRRVGLQLGDGSSVHRPEYSEIEVAEVHGSRDSRRCRGGGRSRSSPRTGGRLGKHSSQAAKDNDSNVKETHV